MYIIPMTVLEMISYLLTIPPHYQVFLNGSEPLTKEDFHLRSGAREGSHVIIGRTYKDDLCAHKDDLCAHVDECVHFRQVR